MGNTSSQKLLAIFNQKIGTLEDAKLRECLMALGQDIVTAIGAQRQYNEFSLPVKITGKERAGSLQVSGLSRLEDVRASGDVSWGTRPFILAGDMTGGEAQAYRARWNEDAGEYEPIPGSEQLILKDPFEKGTGRVAGDVLMGSWDITRGGYGQSLGQDREGEYVVSMPFGLEPGPEGPPGVDGVDGADGVDGVDGADGPGPGGVANDVQINDGVGGFAGVTPGISSGGALSLMAFNGTTEVQLTFNSYGWLSAITIIP